jgi:hypothetical protein
MSSSRSWLFSPPFKVAERLLDALLKHMRASHEAEKQYHTEAIVALRRDYDRAQEIAAHERIGQLCGRVNAFDPQLEPP